MTVLSLKDTLCTAQLREDKLTSSALDLVQYNCAHYQKHQLEQEQSTHNSVITWNNNQNKLAASYYKICARSPLCTSIIHCQLNPFLMPVTYDWSRLGDTDWSTF